MIRLLEILLSLLLNVKLYYVLSNETYMAGQSKVYSFLTVWFNVQLVAVSRLKYGFGSGVQPELYVEGSKNTENHTVSILSKSNLGRELQFLHPSPHVIVSFEEKSLGGTWIEVVWGFLLRHCKKETLLLNNYEGGRNCYI